MTIITIATSAYNAPQIPNVLTLTVSSTLLLGESRAITMISVLIASKGNTSAFAMSSLMSLDFFLSIYNY